ncbi:MAG: choice-of-anchor Q domain-containing protein [Gammaproteobacteria bacterium]
MSWSDAAWLAAAGARIHPQAVLYVATDGSDRNPGTRAAPFATIARAGQAARPGTAIYVGPGQYAGGFRTAASGTEWARISYVSSVRWGARIVPPAISTSTIAWDNRGSYVDIIGFQVDGSSLRQGTPWTNGIYYGGSYGLVRNNWVHHLGASAHCSSAGGAAIGIDGYYRGIHSQVISNLVHDIGPPGCRFAHGIYVSTTGSVVNNVVYRVAGAAIHLWHDARQVLVAHNSIAAASTGIVVGSGDSYFNRNGNDYTLVANNIVYDTADGIAEQGATGANNRYQNNLVFLAARRAWRLKAGTVVQHAVREDPRFVRYGREDTPDLHLRPDSPAVGAASAGGPPHDFDGKPRPSGTRYDIGAFQR